MYMQGNIKIPRETVRSFSGGGGQGKWEENHKREVKGQGVRPLQIQRMLHGKQFRGGTTVNSGHQ